VTRAAILAAVLLASVGATAGHAAPGTSMCTASQLSAGSFRAVPGSAGAGNIVYALELRNTSSTTCTITGLPQGKLLDRAGKAQPTHIVPAFRGALTAVLVHLAPGKSTRATARFSPDVSPCQATSYAFRVTLPGGTTTVTLKPATPVCEHGQLQFSAYGLPT